MEAAEVSARVRQLIDDFAPMLATNVSDSSHLVRDLGYDSLGLLELAAAIEREFALPPISERDVMDVESIDDVERLVLRLVSQASA